MLWSELDSSNNILWPLCIFPSDDYIGTLFANETTDASKTFTYGIYDIDDANIPSDYVDAFDYLNVDATGIVTVKAPMDFEVTTINALFITCSIINK